MRCFGLFATIGVSLLLFLQPAFPQQPSPKPNASTKNVSSKEKSESRLGAERIRKERQAQARSLLVSLASDARSFRDLTLRTRSLARIADALWDIDAEQGRMLFRKAWDTAETADRENGERLNIHDGVVAIKPGDVNPATITSIGSTPDLRKEVLRLVAQHDRTLSEEFLEKLKESQPESKSENTEPGLWDLPPALQQRLNLAQSLLRDGKTERALQLADPVLGNVTISTRLCTKSQLTLLQRLRRPM